MEQTATPELLQLRLAIKVGNSHKLCSLLTPWRKLNFITNHQKSDANHKMLQTKVAILTTVGSVWQLLQLPTLVQTQKYSEYISESLQSWDIFLMYCEDYNSQIYTKMLKFLLNLKINWTTFLGLMCDSQTKRVQSCETIVLRAYSWCKSLFPNFPLSATCL